MPRRRIELIREEIRDYWNFKITPATRLGFADGGTCSRICIIECACASPKETEDWHS